MHSKNPMSNLRITLLCIYNIALGLLSSYVLLTVLQFNYYLSWRDSRSVYMFLNRLHFYMTLELMLLLVVVFSGILSAVIQIISSITLRRLREDLGTERTIFYILGPFIGVGIALLAYFLIASYFYIDINPYQGIEYNAYPVASITSIIVIGSLIILEKLKTTRV